MGRAGPDTRRFPRALKSGASIPRAELERSGTRRTSLAECIIAREARGTVSRGQQVQSPETGLDDAPRGVHSRPT